MDFVNTVVIRRPPHDVFRFLAEFENVPKWNYAIVESRKTLGRSEMPSPRTSTH